MPAPAASDQTTQLTNGIQDVQIQEPQEEKCREISQTDHINKKLLTSLFNRMQEDGNSPLARMLEDNNAEENNEWSD